MMHVVDSVLRSKFGFKSNDGAFEGYLPADVMMVAFSKDDERPPLPEPMDLKAMKTWIDTAPDDARKMDSMSGYKLYNETCRRLAKRICTVYQRYPEAKPITDEDVLWRHMEEGLSAFEKYGITTFMWAWSMNAARRVSGLPEVDNPAMRPIKSEAEILARIERNEREGRGMIIARENYRTFEEAMRAARENAGLSEQDPATEDVWLCAYPEGPLYCTFPSAMRRLAQKIFSQHEGIMIMEGVGSDGSFVKDHRV